MDFERSHIQANILKGHGRKYACFLFFNFSPDASKKSRRKAIARFGRQEITSYEQQLLDTSAYKSKRSSGECYVLGLYLSKKGFEALNIQKEFYPNDPSFRNGMTSSEERRLLGDYTDESEERCLSGDYKFVSPLALIEEPDGMFLIAHSKNEDVKEKAEEIVKSYLGSTAQCSFQFAKTIRDPNGFPIDHFGYSDGVSTPIEEGILWEMGLVKEPGLFGLGSYVVFRKIEQTFDHFKYMIYDLKVRFGETLIRNENYFKALLMGRFPNGTPLALFNQEMPIEKWKDIDFDFEDDKEGSKCPINAHIRMVNPRTRDEKGEFVTRPQIVRRSMQYEEEWNGTLKKGLYFMSYQASIRENFIPLMERMGVENTKKDVLAYRPINNQSHFASYAKEYGNPNSGTIQQLIGGNYLTTFRGGEYFYAPSIPFLKDLESLGAPE